MIRVTNLCQEEARRSFRRTSMNHRLLPKIGLPSQMLDGDSKAALKGGRHLGVFANPVYAHVCGSPHGVNYLRLLHMDESGTV